MHVGDLSRTRAPSEPNDNAARLALRVLLVVGLMSAGWLALWRFQDNGPATEGMVAAVPPQTITVEPRTPVPPDRTPPVQVADADPAAPIALPRKPPPAAVPTDEDEWDQSVAEPTIDVVAIGQSRDQSLAVLKQFEAAIVQSSRKEPSKPQSPPRTDMNMTGTVTQQASLASQYVPADGSAADLVDLNKSSVEDLNRLKGAGSLGRAIVRGRPYKSVEDLVNKRVVRRDTFERIKSQLTVQ